MANVTFDASSSVQEISATGNPSTVTFSHTCGGANRALVVFAEGINTGDYMAGVTYNGVALTKVDEEDVSGTVNDNVQSSWILLNPASGAHNIVVTSGGAYSFISAIALSFNNVHQTGGLGNHAHFGNTNGNGSLSNSVTCAAGNMEVDGLTLRKTSVSFSAVAAGGGQTEPVANFDQGAGSGATGHRIGASYKLSAAAMAWTWTGGGGSNDHYTHLVVELVAAPSNTDLGTGTAAATAAAAAALTTAIKLAGNVAAQAAAQASLGAVSRLVVTLANRGAVVWQNLTGITGSVFVETGASALQTKLGSFTNGATDDNGVMIVPLVGGSVGQQVGVVLDHPSGKKVWNVGTLQ